MNAFKLIAAALASIAWQDAAGKTITPPTGSTAVWTSSDETFATVAPQGDGTASAIVSPVDPTGAAAGSAVITCTLTNPDGTQAIVTGAVANTDDVAVGAMSFGPVPTP